MEEPSKEIFVTVRYYETDTEIVTSSHGTLERAQKFIEDQLKNEVYEKISATVYEIKDGSFIIVKTPFYE